MPKTIFNIPSGRPFLTDFVSGVIDFVDGEIEKLPDIRIFLPTRRACRDVQIAFLRHFNGKPVLLPRLQPLGDVDADDMLIQLAGIHEEIAAQELAIPPAMPPLQRTLILSRLIRSMHNADGTAIAADAAIGLAEELGRLMDKIYTENLDMANLPGLVDEEKLAEHWQITLKFLTILSEQWPHILAEQGKIDAADRRNRLMLQLAHWYNASKTQTITIAAGSSGSIPATAALLSAIANLPNGMVVLPGLDTLIDQKSWDDLTPTHPQYSLKTLLNKMDVSRQDIVPWPLLKTENMTTHTDVVRGWLASEMMRPASTLERWSTLSLNGDQREKLTRSLDGVKLVSCESAEQEAQVIALIMREALETDGKTAALITPDRHLARRVSSACRRWGIIVDDSAGLPLAREKVGSWLLLSARACNKHLSPLATLSMLKHPLASCGMDSRDFRPTVRRFEKRYLRDSKPVNGIAGLMSDPDITEDIKELITRLLDQTNAYLELVQHQQSLPFAQFLNAHIDMAEALAGGEDKLWVGDDGETAALLLAELNESAHLLGDVTGHEYEAILRRLMDRQAVRPAFGAHPRLSILGQLESRLVQADKIIISGLNERVWPPEPEKDPWMSRPMREDFGMPSPDDAIGKSAHDFIQLFTSPDIVLTRSEKMDGTPTVPARWLQRLDAVLGSLNRDPQQPTISISEGPYKSWAETMNVSHTIQAIARPEPCPPVEVRPRTLGVTSIEKWMRDPYHIYAQKILALKKLDPIEKDAEAAERGEWIHNVMEAFVKHCPRTLPENAADILRAFGREHLGEKTNDSRIMGFWWPYFENVIRQYLTTETTWRTTSQPCENGIESQGQFTFEASGGAFTLTAKADRIDCQDDGQFIIIDYKTGAPPKIKDVLSGAAPQLSLEAVILEHSGFPNIDIRPDNGSHDHNVTRLSFWKLDGKSDNAEHTKFVDPHPGRGTKYHLPDIIENAHEGIIELVNAFDDPNTPYISLPCAEIAPRIEFQDYAHLARVKEWSGGGDDAVEDA